MHDEPIPPDEQDAQTDAAIMGLLLIDSTAVWADEEVAREMRDPVATADALNRLAGAGLIHRLDRFVFPTRAATRATQLAVR